MGERAHYSDRTLIGNWQESRLDISTAPRPELERTGQYHVTPIKMTQQPHPPETYLSTTKLHFTPKSPLTAPQQPSLAQAQTLSSVTASHTHAEATRTDIQPPRPIHKIGYGGILPRHEQGHDVRILYTSTHSEYGGRDDAFVEYHQQLREQVLKQSEKDRVKRQEADCERRQQHMLNATWNPNFNEMTKWHVEPESIPKLAEIEESKQPHLPGYKTNINPPIPRPKRNDTIKADLGIWNE